MKKLFYLIFIIFNFLNCMEQAEFEKDSLKKICNEIEVSTGHASTGRVPSLVILSEIVLAKKFLGKFDYIDLEHFIKNIFYTPNTINELYYVKLKNKLLINYEIYINLKKFRKCLLKKFGKQSDLLDQFEKKIIRVLSKEILGETTGRASYENFDQMIERFIIDTFSLNRNYSFTDRMLKLKSY